MKYYYIGGRRSIKLREGRLPFLVCDESSGSISVGIFYDEVNCRHIKRQNCKLSRDFNDKVKGRYCISG